MYETSENLSDENFLAQKMGEKWGLKAIKAPVFCVVDGLFLKKGEPYAFFECKRRHISLNSIPSVFIDKAKLDKSFLGARKWECNLVLIFEFNDGVFYCPITEAPAFDVRIGGPSQQRDAFDRDELYLIPRSNWKKL